MSEGREWTLLSVPGERLERVRCVLVPGVGAAPRDLDWLSRQERRQAEGLARDARRADWLAGRLAAKLAIRAALEADLAPARISVSYAAGGRPLPVVAAARPPDLWLSISHSRGTGLAAAVRGPRPVGVDVEHRAAWTRELCDYALGEEERAGLPAAPSARSVLARWTLKEAGLKALGLGLRVHPRRVAVATECALPAAAASWRLQSPLAVGAGAGWFEHAGRITWAVADAEAAVAGAQAWAPAPVAARSGSGPI